MIINHNMNALNAHRNMSLTNVSQGKAMEKLSSGLRINRASDDAAGLAISEKMRSQIRGLTQASRNAQDGISLIQTAEGALSESQSIVQRMRELSVQSSNGTYTDEDRVLINQEFDQLKHEVDRIATDTEFNGEKLLDGTLQGKEVVPAGSVTQVAGSSNGSNGATVSVMAGNFQEKNQHLFGKLGEGKFELKMTQIDGIDDKKDTLIELIDKTYPEDPYILDSAIIQPPDGGDVSFELYDMIFTLNSLYAKMDGAQVEFTNTSKKVDDGMKIQVGSNERQIVGFNIDNMRARELGVARYNLLTEEASQRAINGMDEAISKLSSQRSSLGALQNRLEHTITSVDNTAENLQASESRIRDVDMAKEMMNLTKLNVLQQASQAMLIQANQDPYQVLSLLT